MNAESPRVHQPLGHLAAAVPAGWGFPVSVLARVLAVAIAAWVIVAQSYDRSQAFAGVLAIAMLLTLAPWRDARPWLCGLGAGLAFFAGAMLWNVGPGILLLPLGVVAGVAALVDAADSKFGVWAATFSFFAGVPAIIAGVVAIALLVEG